jgi:CBS domain-containing protein
MIGSRMFSRVVAQVSTGASRASAVGLRSFASYSSEVPRVEEVMTRSPRIIKPESSLMDAAKLMAELDTGFLPVGTGTDPKSDRLVGMITDRDITIRGVACGLDMKSAKVQQCMSKEVLFAYADESCEDIARNMQEKHIRRLPILERGTKKLVGVVSLGDLATRLGNAAPEVVSRATSGVSQHTSDHSQSGRTMPNL